LLVLLSERAAPGWAFVGPLGTFLSRVGLRADLGLGAGTVRAGLATRAFFAGFGLSAAGPSVVGCSGLGFVIRVGSPFAVVRGQDIHRSGPPHKQANCAGFAMDRLVKVET